MDAIGKALWFIESHFANDLCLDEVASVAGVSRYHVSRMFSATMGISITQYIRGRRLTEAARALVSGAPDILTVALESGYGSHEAFTRAFREQFGVTPEAARAQRQLNTLKLVEARRMDQSLLVDLEPPRIVDGKALLIAGLSEHYGCDSSAGVPAQWQRFLPHFGKVPGQVGNVAYGVMHNQDEEDNFDYVCGVEVPNFSKLPPGFVGVRIPAQKYAVFAHRHHISAIRRTWATIWAKWLPESKYEAVDAPVFERYAEDFDSRTGTGGVEVWVPVKE
jgi:AraC family transcriptional regulator